MRPTVQQQINELIEDRVFHILKSSSRLQKYKKVFAVATGNEFEFYPKLEAADRFQQFNRLSDCRQGLNINKTAQISCGVLNVGMLEIVNGDSTSEYLLKIMAMSLSDYAKVIAENANFPGDN